MAEDPRSPSRDPPAAPWAPPSPGQPKATSGVPFTSFDRASALVQGKARDAYSYAKRFSDAPIGSHTLHGDGMRNVMPASARNSEVVTAALRSLLAKRQVAERERDAWREKFEQAERGGGGGDENGVSTTVSPVVSVQRRVSRIESERVLKLPGAEKEANSVVANTTATDRGPSTRAQDIPYPQREDASQRQSLGFTQFDLEFATRRAEKAEAALRARESADATQTVLRNDSNDSKVSPKATQDDLVKLKAQLHALLAEHRVHVDELNESWAARVRLACSAKTREAETRGYSEHEATHTGTQATRRTSSCATQTTGDYPHTEHVRRNLVMSPARDKASETSFDSESTDAHHRDTKLLKRRVRELESVVTGLTETTRTSTRRRVPKISNHSSAGGGVLSFGLLRAVRKSTRKQSSRRSSCISSYAASSESEWVSDVDELGGTDEAQKQKARLSAQDMTKRKPWGSGFATSNVDGKLGLSPLKETAIEAEANRRTNTKKAPVAPAVFVRNRKPLVSLSSVDAARHGVQRRRPPFRGSAKQISRVALPIAVARTAGGFRYESNGNHITEFRAKKETSLLKLKLARVAAKRRGATVAAVRAGSITESPAASSLGVSREVSHNPSPAPSPKRATFFSAEPNSESETEKQTELASLRKTFNATRAEYDELTRAMTSAHGGGHAVDDDALDDVIDRLREVSTAIAKRAAR